VTPIESFSFPYSFSFSRIILLPAAKHDANDFQPMKHFLHFLRVAALTCFIGIFVATTRAQADQPQINEQVWKPFTRAIIERDLELYFTVHSPEIIRAELRASKISGFAAYREDMRTYWSQPRPADAPPDTFELRFTKRVSNGKAAYETGYYKSEFTRPTGQRGVYYGAFHVVLRKENDRWKILVDADGFDGPRPTEETFKAAQSLESK
jgi:ketosteroid isomerase-like protein